LLNLVQVPLKMLQIISEGIGAAYDVNHACNKWKLGGDLAAKQKGEHSHTKKRLEEECLREASVLDTARREEENQHLKATKNDKAWVPTELWEGYLLRPFAHWKEIQSCPCWPKALKVLQQFGLQRWWRDKLRSYMRWKQKNADKPAHFMKQAHEAASDALERASLATWWDWPSGSRPLFWNWPEEVQTEVKVGLEWWL